MKSSATVIVKEYRLKFLQQNISILKKSIKKKHGVRDCYLILFTNRKITILHAGTF